MPPAAAGLHTSRSESSARSARVLTDQSVVAPGFERGDGSASMRPVRTERRVRSSSVSTCAVANETTTAAAFGAALTAGVMVPPPRDGAVGRFGLEREDEGTTAPSEMFHRTRPVLGSIAFSASNA